MRQNEIIHSLCESSIKTECLTGCGKIVINVLTWNTCLLTKCVLMNIIYCPACYNILISHIVWLSLYKFATHCIWFIYLFYISVHFLWEHIRLNHIPYHVSVNFLYFICVENRWLYIKDYCTIPIYNLY